MSDSAELISRYEAKVAEHPENGLVRFSLGKALFDAGRFSEAEVHLQKALSTKPDWMVVTMLLAQCALRRNDKPAAKALYENALQFAIDQKHADPEAEIRAALADL